MSAIGTHAENGKRIVAGWRTDAVHFLAPGTPGPWGGKPLARIACGRAVPYDADRWTKHSRNVTCDACRMTPEFQAARSGQVSAPPLSVVKRVELAPGDDVGEAFARLRARGGES